MVVVSVVVAVVEVEVVVAIVMKKTSAGVVPREQTDLSFHFWTSLRKEWLEKK